MRVFNLNLAKPDDLGVLNENLSDEKIEGGEDLLDGAAKQIQVCEGRVLEQLNDLVKGRYLVLSQVKVSQAGKLRELIFDLIDLVLP